MHNFKIGAKCNQLEPLKMLSIRVPKMGYEAVFTKVTLTGRVHFTTKQIHTHHRTAHEKRSKMHPTRGPKNAQKSRYD